jgi:arabinose-5-phosphate isomerase
LNVHESLKRVFDIEIRGLAKARDMVCGGLVEIVEVLAQCKGKIVLCGIGKPGHIGRKISSTMASLGLPSVAMHPSEGLHGDLGMLEADDIIIIISNSGESEEVCRLLPNIKMIGTKIIGMTSAAGSTVAQYSDYLIAMPKLQEACFLNLAPTSSTTAQLAVGDALAVVVAEYRQFNREKYAVYHPAGVIGNKLTLRVSDIMHSGERNPVVNIDSLLVDAINEMTQKGLGIVSVVDNRNVLRGVFTNGDLTRLLQRKADIYHEKIETVMNYDPVYIHVETLAVDALKIMMNPSRTVIILPVVNDKNEVMGVVSYVDVSKQNIFL